MMPAYSWLFAVDSAHDQAVTEFIQKYDTNHDGRVTKSELEAIGQLPANFKDLDVYPLNADGSHGDGIIDMHDYGPVPTEEMVGVEAYMQKIGTAIGDWQRGRHGRPCADHLPTNRSNCVRR